MINTGHCLVRYTINTGHCLVQYTINTGHCLVQYIINTGHCLVQDTINTGHKNIMHTQEFGYLVLHEEDALIGQKLTRSCLKWVHTETGADNQCFHGFNLTYQTGL